MNTEQLIRQNLASLASTLSAKLEETNGTYEVEAADIKLNVTLQPKWVGLELAVNVAGEQLYYQTDTDLYDVSDSNESEFREAIALDINAILESLLTNSFLTGEFKKRPSMIIPRHEDAMRIKKGKFAFSGRQFESVAEARSTGTYSPLAFSE